MRAPMSWTAGDGRNVTLLPVYGSNVTLLSFESTMDRQPAVLRDLLAGGCVGVSGNGEATFSLEPYGCRWFRT